MSRFGAGHINQYVSETHVQPRAPYRVSADAVEHDGVVRTSMVHYNDQTEVAKLIHALNRIF